MSIDTMHGVSIVLVGWGNREGQCTVAYVLLEIFGKTVCAFVGIQVFRGNWTVVMQDGGRDWCLRLYWRLLGVRWSVVVVVEGGVAIEEALGELHAVAVKCTLVLQNQTCPWRKQKHHDSRSQIDFRQKSRAGNDDDISP